MAISSVCGSEHQSNLSRFDLVDLPLRRSLQVRRACDTTLDAAIRITAEHFPHVEQLTTTIWRVHRYSRSIFIAYSDCRPIGTAALLCLNQTGFVQLLAGNLSPDDPESAGLVRVNEKAIAIYVWMLCLPGSSVAAMGHMMQWLIDLGLACCDLYACPASSAGERFMRKTGFQPVGTLLGVRPLWVYRRRAALPSFKEA